MTTYTTPYSLPVIEPAVDLIKDAGSTSALADAINRLANAANEAIGIDGARITDLENTALPDRGRATAELFPTVDSIVTNGRYSILLADDAVSLGLPSANGGDLDVYANGSILYQRYWVLETSWQIYLRRRNAGVWSTWEAPFKTTLAAAKWETAGSLTGTPATLAALPSGIRHVYSATAAQDLGLPVLAGGIVTTIYVNSASGIQYFNTFGAPRQNWQREREGSVWTTWHRTDAGAITVPKETSNGSGFKILPLCVTLPATGSKVVATARQERHMMSWAAPITRWKIHARNFDYRLNAALTGTVTFTGVYVGEHDMTTTPTFAFKTTPTLIAAAGTMVDGAEWVSAWINTPLEADKEYLLSLGYTAASGQEFFVQVGSVGADTANTNAGIVTAPTGTGLATLDVWIEAETYATTPSFAVLDDSTGSGVGAQYTVRDSWPTQYARAKKALPVHYTASGDSYNAWTNLSWGKWTRWQAFDKPDSLIAGLGNNDVFQGADLATLQGRVNAIIPELKKITSNNFYWATVFPRTGVTGAMEAVRRDFNSWMRSLPHGARDCFEISAAISADDETIIPAYDADGVHLNTAGYAAVAAAITRPVTTPAVMYVS